MQLLCDQFVQSIVQLISAHGFDAADLRTLWTQLFGSQSAVTRATWNERLWSAGIHVPLDSQSGGAVVERKQQQADSAQDNVKPTDRLITLLDQIMLHPSAPLVCQAVQFECRSNVGGPHALMNEACELYGCVTLDKLKAVLERCFQRYRVRVFKKCEDSPHTQVSEGGGKQVNVPEVVSEGGKTGQCP